MRVCKICNKEYELSEDGAGYKYCSQNCSDEARRIRNKEKWRKDNPDWDKGTNKVCKWCGVKFTVPARNAHIARFCSDKCRDTWHSRQDGRLPWDEWKVILAKQKEETKKIKEVERKAKIKTKECLECGKPFETTQPNKLTCSTECSRLRRNRLSWQRKEERYNDTNLVDKDISVKVLYKRDKGICYICGGMCDFQDHTKTNSYFTAGPTYPSIDHLIPIARGGMHAWDNVKLAHHSCNAKKSDILPNELGLDVDIDNAYALAKKVSPLKKEVRQLSSEGKLIKVYESTVEASRQTGIPTSTIQNNARGENKALKHGFIFEYV